MLRRYTKEGGKPEMAGTWSTGVGNKGRENRTQGRGRKPKGNTPGTRAGRPVEDRYRSRNKMVIIAIEGIEKGDGGAILRGDITQTSRKMAKGP